MKHDSKSKPRAHYALFPAAIMAMAMMTVTPDAHAAECRAFPCSANSMTDYRFPSKRQSDAVVAEFKQSRGIYYVALAVKADGYCRNIIPGTIGKATNFFPAQRSSESRPTYPSGTWRARLVINYTCVRK